MTPLEGLHPAQKFFRNRELILRGTSVVAHECEITTPFDYPLPLLVIRYTTCTNFGFLDDHQRRDLQRFTRNYFNIECIFSQPLVYVPHKHPDKVYLQTRIS